MILNLGCGAHPFPGCVNVDKAKYVPKPTAKSRSGITKPTIEAKKAKNRARRKANKGNR